MDDLKHLANLRDLIAATGQVILYKLDWNLWFWGLCDLEIWWMTSKNNRAPILYYIKLCALFKSHRRKQIGVTVQKRSTRVKISNFFPPVTLKFDGWPRKTIGHLFYTMLSFVHHLKTMGEFKLELQSGKAQFGSNSMIFCPLWPWNLVDDIQQGKSEGFDSCDRPSNLTQIGLKWSIFRPCDLEIWRMTPKNNKACLLYYIKLCVSFQIHQWIQTGITVRKRPIWVKFDNF